MANNKAIKILRTTDQGITDSIKDVELLEGQPFYNKQKNYLTVGHKDPGNGNVISQEPITVRDVKGYFADTPDGGTYCEMTNTMDGATYSIQPEVGPSNSYKVLLMSSSDQIGIQASNDVGISSSDKNVAVTASNGNFTVESKNITIKDGILEFNSGMTPAVMSSQSSKFVIYPKTPQKGLMLMSLAEDDDDPQSFFHLATKGKDPSELSIVGELKINDDNFSVYSSTDNSLNLENKVKIQGEGQTWNTEDRFIIKNGNLQADRVYFSQEIKTSYPIGTKQDATYDNRVTLFDTDNSLQKQLEELFDPTIQPEIVAPKLTLTLDPSSVTGELGALWPTIITNTSTTNGSYPFGPTETGVTWTGSATITPSGNTTGIFGNGNRTYTATQNYTATGDVALDNKGNASNPEQKITSGSDRATGDVTETVLYRQFYGNVAGTTKSEILANLTKVTDTDNSKSLPLKTYLQNNNPSEITVTLSENGYIYFVTKNTIKGASMGGSEFPITSMGTETFTNSYNKTYDVNVYKSSLEQTPNTYTIKLS